MTFFLIFFQSFWGVEVEASRLEWYGREAWRQMLTSCWNEDVDTDSAEFILDIPDDDYRNLQIMFRIRRGFAGASCVIDFDESPDNFRGHLVSINKNNGKNVERTSPLFDMTGIEIQVHSGANPRWEMASLFPNNLISGKAMRSFIIQGMSVHAEMIGHSVKLGLHDQSDIREQFWLEKGWGLTYYEAVWNLEYECLLEEKSAKEMILFHQISASADSLPAMIALRDVSFEKVLTYRTRRPKFAFTLPFRIALEDWNATKTHHELESMTVRQVLDEFIPTWKDQFSSAERTGIAQSTFFYFFRHHPNFQDIARQVVFGYDSECDRASGIPRDPSPRTIHVRFVLKGSPQHSKIVTSPDTVSHFCSLLNSFFIYFLIFTIVIFCFWWWLHLQKVAISHDVYSELL